MKVDDEKKVKGHFDSGSRGSWGFNQILVSNLIFFSLFVQLIWEEKKDVILSKYVFTYSTVDLNFDRKHLLNRQDETRWHRMFERKNRLSIVQCQQVCLYFWNCTPIWLMVN